ncbi:diguanylate cyclase/phosphodiesterase with PAS/PAC sensor(s) [Oscillochloris trichoides DG-6]|uniref:Diguanylate cyclase/phosphodiesterase with PAS/PAC sensor(S) n=1 Tax=Oscillochloris trichoides DG-6 TaxID=765420 RepID=E1ID22_9CHLR|nr:EAL domain-containing protein [Oscillochloris trichoides]EFO80931.1 diguanylate cyclase/phosphodiesterase with PAS/PAC sensor(s) [Oscillochloris trichoides DG-6]
MKLSLTIKFIIFLHLASIIPLLIVGLSSYEVYRTSLYSELKRSTNQLVQQQQEYLDLQLDQIESLITNISSVETITHALAEEPTANDSYTRLATQARIGYILDGYANLRGLVSIDIFTLGGNHYHVGDTLDVSNIRTDVRDRLVLRARSLGPSEIWAGIEQNVNTASSTEQVLTVLRLISVTERGSPTTRPIAALLVNYDITYLYQHFQNIDLGDNGILIVVDSDRHIVYHPDQQMIGVQISAGLTQQFQTTQDDFIATIDGQELFVSYARLNRYDWTVISLIPTSTLNARTATISTAMGIALVAAFTIAGLAAMLISYSVVRPLRQLTRRFQLYRADAPGWQTPLAVRGNDEIAELTRWFNLFSESLQVRQKIEEQLRHQATHDALTGLPNRMYFSDQLAITLAKNLAGEECTAAVLFLDLDRFKIVNDSLGHAAGDQVLIITARRLRAAVRGGDTLARLGGDEFAILLSQLNGTDEAIQIADRIREELGAPFEVQGVEVALRASIGIAMISSTYSNPDDLLREADTAMYRAKAAGGTRYMIFDDVMHQQSMEILRLEADLRHAISRHELHISYQPIIRLDNGAIQGFEALVRWQHPERGEVKPRDFLPLAEETELIQQIDMWVLRSACADLRHWHEAGHTTLGISVNLSARNFQNMRLVEQIQAIILEAGVPAKSIQLEITERAIMTDTERTISTLEQLSDLGIHIAIDDFGTNYSSLAFLKRLPANSVKIDRSFVNDISTSIDAATLTSAIIAMGHVLGLKIIAEGVEQSEQQEFLSNHGCDLAQGNLFSLPIRANQVTNLLASGWQSESVAL